MKVDEVAAEPTATPRRRNTMAVLETELRPPRAGSTLREGDAGFNRRRPPRTAFVIYRQQSRRRKRPPLAVRKRRTCQHPTGNSAPKRYTGGKHFLATLGPSPRVRFAASSFLLLRNHQDLCFSSTFIDLHHPATSSTPNDEPQLPPISILEPTPCLAHRRPIKALRPGADCSPQPSRR